MPAPSRRSPARHAPTRTLTAALGLLALSAGALSAQMPSSQRAPLAPVPGWVGGEGAANYQLAARFAPYKIRDLVHSTSVNPTWIETGDRFWYAWTSAEGTRWMIVDPARGTRELLFDNDRLAAELTRITRDPWDGQNIPVRNLRFISDFVVQFEVQSSQEEKYEVEQGERRREQRDEQRDEELEQEEQQQDTVRTTTRTRRKVHYFHYDTRTRELTELEDYEAPDRHPGWASVSPDRRWVVFSREFNMWKMSYDDYMKIVDARRGLAGTEAERAENRVEVEEIQLTTDGEEHYSYGNTGRGQTDVETAEEHKKRQSAGITWSHDGRWFAFTRSDRREVGDLWVVHTVGSARPRLESYKYDMPGDENVTQVELMVFNVESREFSKIDDDPWKDQRMGLWSAPAPDDRTPEDPPGARWISDRSDELLFWRRSRDQKRVDVMRANPATGEVEVIIEERLNTYVEHQTPRRLANGDLIWWSERDGWAHLYRIAPDGSVVARLTEGPWHVSGVEELDEERGFVYLRANAREVGEDPYYQHLYRVRMDGRGLELLNPGNYDHRTSMSPTTRYFVNSYSRVDTIPHSSLHDASGRKIMDLEVADFSSLMASGYQFPEPFRVKADDGKTDIYGVMYKPYDFDPARVYPIVAYVYPGPQTESVAKSFSTAASEQALAQFGMIVITLGNRGGHPDRSKWYHNYGYGNLRDYGLADKKTAIEQLADRHSFVDVERVGIYGHSGGGFMSTAAMLVYPDFFKVAVSSAGNHENNIYNQNWSEKHHGITEKVDDDGKVTFEFSIDRNSQLAENLRGHLLLTTGDVDNNVHHAGTFRMAEALIRANKRFDFFVYPGQRHGYGNMGDYWFWQRAEYFVKHLLGDTRWNADIVELNRERALTRPGR
ncbi:MAG: S9 family peptidase [Gemmatimonadales bacterium]|nr:MAG: S9 family peptidase [Gemmatimonadales bacterium]